MEAQAHKRLAERFSSLLAVGCEQAEGQALEACRHKLLVGNGFSSFKFVAAKELTKEPRRHETARSRHWSDDRMEWLNRI